MSSFLRKLGPLDAIPGLAVETFILAAAAVIGAGFGLVSLSYPLAATTGKATTLLACGIVSIIPLWLFAVANRALPLSTLGFFQYLLPTTQFVLAVTFYGQLPSANTLVSLAFVWVALGIVLIEATWRHRREHRATAAL